MKIFGSCVVSLFLLVLSGTSLARPQEVASRDTALAYAREGGQEVGQENHSEATISIKVILVGVTSYNDYLEIKTGILKSEGVDKVILDAEAPGLVSLTVKYAGEPNSLIEKLTAFFPKKYSMKEKRSSAGGTEITIATK